MVQQQRNGVSVVGAAVVATQQHDKHISATTNPDTTIEELCFLRVPCPEAKSETRFRA
jgi:hypothetical protein